MPFRIIIVGGGLAGNLLACGLMRNNVDVQVYESAERHSNREGLQIRLTAPALAGLRRCLDHEHLMTIIKKFGPATDAKAEAPRVFHKDWSLLMDLSRFPAYGKNAPITRGLLRDCLADPLYDAGKLKYSTSFDRYEILHSSSGGERVRVWLNDGSYDDCDILVGADGSYSKVNKIVGLNSLDYIPKHVTMAAKCSLPIERFASMSRALVGGPVMCWADNKHIFFGVYLPSKRGDGSYSDEKLALNSQKVYDEGLASCMISLIIEKDMLPKGMKDRPLDEQYDFMADTVRDWAPPFHEMIELMRGAPLHTYVPRVAKQPPKNWRRKVQQHDRPELGHPRVWLMGDAIHAMLPPRGMGGNQAMYDAGQMLQFLTDLAHKESEKKSVSTDDISMAVDEFETEMLPRAFNWVKKSGGDNFIPLNTSNMTSRLLLVMAGQWLTLVNLFASITRFFSRMPVVDETPEFNLI